MKNNFTKNKDFWFCADFETTTAKTEYFKKTQDTKVILWSIQKYGNYEKFNNGFDIKSFWEFLVKLGKSATIFFHNLSFDGSFIIAYLSSIGVSFNLDNDEFKKITGEIFSQGKKIYYIKIKIKAKKNEVINIIFRDSLALLPTSIKNLGKSLNIEKFQNGQENNKNFYDREEVTTEDKDFIEYCNRDVEILNRSLNNFYEMISNIPAVKNFNKGKDRFCAENALTAGALSMKLLRNIYLKKYDEEADNREKFLAIDEETERWSNESQVMRGAYTNFNMNYRGEPQDVGRAACVDIVSSYPFQMTGALPYGKPYSRAFPGAIEFVEVLIKDVKIKDKFFNFPILPRGSAKIDDRYIKNYNGFLSFTFEKSEWEIVKKLYNFELISEKSVFFKKAAFLKNFIEDLFNLRAEFKRQKNEAYKLIIKIMINSVYGKLLESNKKENFTFSTAELAENDIVYFEKDVLKIKYRTVHSFGDLKCYKCEKINVEKKFRNRIAGAYILAKARVKLFEKVLEIGVENWLQSDTDSVFFKVVPENEFVLNNTSSELGGWELEEKCGSKFFNRFGVMAAKRYCCFNGDSPWKTGLAGIKLDYTTAKAAGLNFDEECVVFGANLIFKRTKSGVVLIEQDKKFRPGSN